MAKECVESLPNVSISNIIPAKRGVEEWELNGGFFCFELFDSKTRARKYYAVDITNTPCSFGGVRYWFVCPTCSKRVGKLFENGSELSCRNCLDLTYEERQTKGSRFFEGHRSLKKLQRINEKLEKKGIHKKTRFRLLEDKQRLEKESIDYFRLWNDSLRMKVDRVSQTI